jgi:ribonuclease P protein component
VALNCSFPKSRRLRKRADFLAVQRSGNTQHCRYFVVVSEQQAKEREAGRLGITVSKKVGNAVTRNRVKRAVREFVRTASPIAESDSAQTSWLPRNLDVVVIAKKEAATASSATLWSALESCRDRLHRESATC